MNGLRNALGRSLRSLTARLLALLIAAFILMFAFVRAHLSVSFDREFQEGLQSELFGRIELVQSELRELPSTRDIAAHRERLTALVRGHHRVFLALLDPGGAALYQSAAFDTLDATLPARIREQVLAEREGELARRENDEFYARTARTWVGADHDLPVWIAVAISSHDYAEFLAGHRNAMLLALAFGSLLVGIGGWWLIRSGLAPLRRLAAVETRISGGHLDERIEAEAVPVEFERLVAGFNAMLDRLNDSFGRLRNFSSDLAHELRTPINSLIGHAQVALSRPRTAEEYSSALQSIAEDGERVARIVREMLFLAQADDASAVLKKERFELRAELDNVVAYFDIVAREYGVAFACEGRGEVVADRAMVQRAIGNLLSNALSHTPRGGTISVNIRPASPRGVSLEVSNPGPGIPAEHLPRIFDRFYQVSAERSDPSGRVGLGLAIVKSIMDLHGGSVEVESPPGGLTSFRLRFPA